MQCRLAWQEHCLTIWRGHQQGAGDHRAGPERQSYGRLLLRACASAQARHAQVGLTVAGGGQDATLGDTPFHAQALTALGLNGAGANLEIAFGGDPPVDSRLLVS